MAFMRHYAMNLGDPGPKPTPKRKQAGAGPRAKAQRKRVVRSNRAMRGHQGAPKGPGKHKGGGLNLGALVGKGADIAQQFLPGGAIASKLGLNLSDLGKLLPHEAEAMGVPPEAVAAAKKATKGKGGRKRRNPANVKALRHALGRVEGFGRLVKRVNRMLPRAHHFEAHPVLKHKRRRKSA